MDYLKEYGYINDDSLEEMDWAEYIITTKPGLNEIRRIFRTILDDESSD